MTKQKWIEKMIEMENRIKDEMPSKINEEFKNLRTKFWNRHKKTLIKKAI